MRYCSSTPSTAESPVSLRRAVADGLAPGRSLYIPFDIPRIPTALFNNIAGFTLQEIAYMVADTFFGNELAGGDVKRIVDETLSFDIPLRRVRPDLYALELFHGPTMAFKDVGARFLAALTPRLLRSRDTIKVLVATAGDTGGAIANAFYRHPGVEVYIVYPMHKMSRVQTAQFTSLGGNIHPLALTGTFDDCQSLVKGVIEDRDFTERYSVVSGNSINVARLLPQTFYYFHGYARLVEQGLQPGTPIVVSVPSGNLGNLTAGVIASKMGLPVKRFVAVNNSNDVTARYLATGQFEPRPAVKTLASSMDVGSPGNMQRLQALYGHSYSAMAAEIVGAGYTDDEIADTMRQALAESDYLLDPHSATAYRALCDTLAPGETGMFLATASPAKFHQRVEQVTGRKVELPPALTAALSHRPLTQRIERSPEVLKSLLSHD